MCWKTGSRNPHQHFQVPAIRHVAHGEAVQPVAPYRAKWRQVGETCAVNKAQEQVPKMGGHDLLWRQAAGLTQPTNARAENEDGPSFYYRQHQFGNEFW